MALDYEYKSPTPGFHYAHLIDEGLSYHKSSGVIKKEDVSICSSS